MSESLTKLLLRLSEAGDPVILTGGVAKSYSESDFEGYLNRRLVVEQPPATDWPPCVACECGLDARPVQSVDGRWVAACPLDSASDVSLDEGDLRRFEINIPAIVREIASASGFGNDPNEVIDGVWFLGSTPGGRAVFVAPSTSAARQPALNDCLRAAANGTPITIAAPDLPALERRRFREAGIHCVIIQDVLRTEGASSFALDLGGLVPASSIGPRLVVLRSQKTVLLDGSERLIPEQPFKLLDLLVEKAVGKGGFATNGDIEERLWGNRAHQVSRPIRDVIRDLRSALRGSDNAQPDAGQLIEAGRASRGYRLRLRAEEIAIES